MPNATALREVPVFEAGREGISLAEHFDSPSDHDYSTIVQFVRVRPRQKPANDNGIRHPLDRKPNESAAHWIARRNVARSGRPLATYRPSDRRSPLEDEYSAGRVAASEMRTAGEVEGLVHVASLTWQCQHPRDLPLRRLNAPEQAIYARELVARLQRAAGHLWRIVEEVSVFQRRSMTEIGRDFGYGTEKAATVGREKAIDGLKLVGAELGRIWCEERAA